MARSTDATATRGSRMNSPAHRSRVSDLMPVLSLFISLCSALVAGYSCYLQVRPPQVELFPPTFIDLEAGPAPHHLWAQITFASTGEGSRVELIRRIWLE